MVLPLVVVKYKWTSILSKIRLIVFTWGSHWILLCRLGRCFWLIFLCHFPPKFVFANFTGHSSAFWPPVYIADRIFFLILLSLHFHQLLLCYVTCCYIFDLIYFIFLISHRLAGGGISSVMSLQLVWAPDARWPPIATWPPFAIASLYYV